MEGMVMLKGWTTGRLLALIRRFTGNLASLTTPSKADLVSAINSLNPQFSETPVYDVTLGEDTAATSGTPYVIPSSVFDGTFSCAAVMFYSPPATAAGAVRLKVSWGSVSYEGQCNNGLYTTERYALALIKKESGAASILWSVGSGSSAATLYGSDSANFPVIVGANAMSGMRLWAFGGINFPAGTRITIYAAKEAE